MQFKNVGFVYNASDWVIFEDLNMIIPLGTSVFIEGGDDAGKSTFMKVGFHKPSIASGWVDKFCLCSSCLGGSSTHRLESYFSHLISDRSM